jgi:hypothetical protein
MGRLVNNYQEKMWKEAFVDNILTPDCGDFLYQDNLKFTIVGLRDEK